MQVSTKKLSSVLFPRRCCGIINISQSKILAAKGEVLSLENLGSATASSTVQILVIASARRITMMPLNAPAAIAGGIGVVHFQHDSDSRKGVVTCLAVNSSGDESVLVTGHEKGSITVWHNMTQYYLNALTAAQRVADAEKSVNNNANNNDSNSAGEGEKKHKKSKSGHSKKHSSGEIEFTAPLCTIMHWHAHAGERKKS